MAIVKTKGYQFEPAQGYLGRGPRKDTYRYMIINDRVEEVREIVVRIPGNRDWALTDR